MLRGAQTAAIVRAENETYYATAVIEQGGRQTEVDERLNDGVSMAMGGGAPIFAAESPPFMELRKRGGRG